ncbi:MAG: hypothetical protein CVT92_14830 [Bacteroidetes bacterium HGW-Bacteroidetes-1]|jgi:hypothetical protein|nr:MAG: hypothetical protein CVT92_14830 [Bacteroidetes bacterium HGW-Bacteroidetes-1]
MKHLFKKAFVLFCVVVLALPSFSQVSTNVEALNQISREQEKEWRQMQKRVKQYARQNQIEIRQEYPDGTIVELIDVIDGQPIFYKTDNLGAAITTRANRLWQGGTIGVVVEGEGYSKVGIWDGGAVRRTHQEFNNTGVQRVTQVDNATSQSAHSTHVAGTIIAGGVNANAKGMAHKATLKAYDWTSVESEMSTAATNGMEISNHSWGMVRGWDQNQTTGTWSWNGTASVSPDEDYLFGFYNSQARTWDIIAYNAPYFLISKSAGNDRGEGPSNAGTGGNAEKDGGLDGYDCIGGSGVSKNILTVGAVNEVLNYTGPQNVIMSGFSGWGPADDGRIKPDIVGKGVNVYSSTSTNNSSYASYNGTSMSSPNVVGSMSLLQQLYQQTHNGTPMRSSSLKGLVIHTADEAGADPGPDYKFGWGLMNTEKAATIILEDGGMQNVIDEIVLENNGVYSRDVTVSGSTPFRVTICWTDKNGNVPTQSLNPRTPVIIHDLDLRILDENLNVYYPYKLDYDNPANAATTDSKNFVDNVEQIYFSEPVAGTYTILVDHAGTISPNQVFSLIISGIDEFEGLPECSEGMIDPVPGFDEAFLNHKITWVPAAFATGYELYFGTDGNGVTLPSNVLNGETVLENYVRLNLEPETTYYLVVKPKNSFGVNDCETIYSFTTMATTSELPYLMNVESVTAPLLPEHWGSMDFGSMSWATTSLIGYNSSKSFACFTTNGQTSPLNNYLVSPPFQVDADKEYMVSFAYRCFNPSVPESIKLIWGPYADTNYMTNVLFDNPSFNAQDWLLANSLIVPGFDGYIFLSWHAYSADGMGQFVDNVLLEDWGPVGVAESPERKIRVFNRDGVLVVESEFDLNKVEITVVNAAGQTLLSEKISATRKFEKKMEFSNGIYVINIKGEGFEKNSKLLIN